LIEVRIPKEIREYKEKLFFGLNIRQTVTTALALAICVPLYIMGQKYINKEILSWLVIAIAAPLILIGYFNFNQMPFEKFIVTWFNMNFNPQKRKFVYMPVFTVIRKEIINDDKQAMRLESEALKKQNKRKPGKNSISKKCKGAS